VEGGRAPGGDYLLCLQTCEALLASLVPNYDEWPAILVKGETHGGEYMRRDRSKGVHSLPLHPEQLDAC